MTKTPGPWSVYEEKALDYRPCQIIGECGSRIATCEGGGPKRAVTKAEERANARLIAAAPDLLAALKELTRLHGGPVFQGDSCTEGNGIAAARDAITKATGGC